MNPIKTALISVYDKAGLEDMAQCLHRHGVEILSTGGTLKFLRDKGIPAVSISDYTGQPEILGGRVKTLHPMIFAGILARRSNPDDMRTLAGAGIKPIDLVVVNLYPFQETVSKPEVTMEEAVEQIDIGGVALLRAAAKNHDDVLVVSRPSLYPLIISQLEGDGNEADDLLPIALAADTFTSTSEYDEAIYEFFDDALPEESPVDGHPSEEHPDEFTPEFTKIQDLRYGENPHQTAAFYRLEDCRETSMASAKQLHGKELSYNNIVDLDSALEIVRAFGEPTCCVIKHNNPCGVARADSLKDAYIAARDCDRTSAFGGVIGFNREVDAETATHVAELFTEAVIAPRFSGEALEILSKKKNVRLIETGAFTPPGPQMMLKSVVGGLLVQDRDLGEMTRDKVRVVTKARPSDEDYDGLLFAWRVAKFVKSNAIIYTSRNATIGIGAGQMSRIDSTRIAAVKAASPVRGAYMASDAFFPFRDNVDMAAEIGIRAIIQPGGSVRDDEVIAAADEHGLIMLLTGMRHFRH
jgi:phosphoribosylaminoimidazolecarboxamide formyltransferase/IMP cyclohydrolase